MHDNGSATQTEPECSGWKGGLSEGSNQFVMLHAAPCLPAARRPASATIPRVVSPPAVQASSLAATPRWLLRGGEAGSLNIATLHYCTLLPLHIARYSRSLSL
jgi:hypothetical protein